MTSLLNFLANLTAKSDFPEAVGPKITISFLCFFVALTLFMLFGYYKIAVEKVVIENYIVAFVTSVYTGLSMKVNTIVEFLFGSSLENKTQDNEKN